MKHLLLIFIVSILVFGCQRSAQKKSIENLKTEIEETEKAFMEMSQKKGLAKAFTFYAADSAVIKRGESLIKGKQNIYEMYNQPSLNTNIKLTWKPDFIDVSASGDMAYTYGNYTYSYTDTTGTKQELKGIFHTVWKRQADGTWKYVYD